MSAIQLLHEDRDYHVRRRRKRRGGAAAAAAKGVRDEFSCMNVSLPGQNNQLLVRQNITHSFVQAADLMPLGEFSSVTGAVRLLEQTKRIVFKRWHTKNRCCVTVILSGRRFPHWRKENCFPTVWPPLGSEMISVSRT